MQKAIWKGTPLAQVDDTIVVDGYMYFPRAAVRDLKPIEKTLKDRIAFWRGVQIEG